MGCLGEIEVLLGVIRVCVGYVRGCVRRCISSTNETSPSSSPQGSCIYWSDGTVTTSNASRCLPKEDMITGAE